MADDGTVQQLGHRKRMVWAYDTTTRMLVKSHSRPDQVHLVDLMAFHRNGECTCEGFMGHCSRKAKKIQDPSQASDKTRCIHIRIARAFLFDQVLNRLEQIET